MVKFENVTFCYGERHVLNDFDLAVPEGARVCLFGPSGCGKSTVLRLVMGLEKPNKGRVICRAPRIAPVFQEDRLLMQESVAHNVRFGCHKDGLALLAAVRLEAEANKRPDQLSGGQRRRVALCRALNYDAPLLVLDEPFNGLDDESVALCVDAIKQTAGNRTILMVSHDIGHARLLDAEILSMHG